MAKAMVVTAERMDDRTIITQTSTGTAASSSGSPPMPSTTVTTGVLTTTPSISGTTTGSSTSMVAPSLPTQTSSSSLTATTVSTSGSATTSGTSSSAASVSGSSLKVGPPFMSTPPTSKSSLKPPSLDGVVVDDEFAAQIGLDRQDSDFDNTNLYVKGLWKDCSQVELDDLFKKYGVIQQSRVYGDGVGFVRYAKGDSARMAIEEMHNQKVDPRIADVLVVKFAYRKTRNPKRLIRVGEEEVEMIMNKNTNNVYLRCLPRGFVESDLQDLCEPYGELTCTRMRESGVAFVRFRRHQDAATAIRELNGKRLPQHGPSDEVLLAKLANSDPFQPKIGFRQSAEGGDKPMIMDREMTAAMIAAIERAGGKVHDLAFPAATASGSRGRGSRGGGGGGGGSYRGRGFSAPRSKDAGSSVGGVSSSVGSSMTGGRGRGAARSSYGRPPTGKRSEYGPREPRGHPYRGSDRVDSTEPVPAEPSVDMYGYQQPMTAGSSQAMFDPSAFAAAGGAGGAYGIGATPGATTAATAGVPPYGATASDPFGYYGQMYGTNPYMYSGYGNPYDPSGMAYGFSGSSMPVQTDFTTQFPQEFYDPSQQFHPAASMISSSSQKPQAPSSVGATVGTASSTAAAAAAAAAAASAAGSSSSSLPAGMVTGHHPSSAAGTTSRKMDKELKDRVKSGSKGVVPGSTASAAPGVSGAASVHATMSGAGRVSIPAVSVQGGSTAQSLFTPRDATTPSTTTVGLTTPAATGTTSITPLAKGSFPFTSGFLMDSGVFTPRTPREGFAYDAKKMGPAAAVVGGGAAAGGVTDSKGVSAVIPKVTKMSSVPETEATKDVPLFAAATAAGISQGLPDISALKIGGGGGTGAAAASQMDAGNLMGMGLLSPGGAAGAGTLGLFSPDTGVSGTTPTTHGAYGMPGWSMAGATQATSMMGPGATGPTTITGAPSTGGAGDSTPGGGGQITSFGISAAVADQIYAIAEKNFGAGKAPKLTGMFLQTHDEVQSKQLLNDVTSLLKDLSKLSELLSSVTAY